MVEFRGEHLPNEGLWKAKAPPAFERSCLCAQQSGHAMIAHAASCTFTVYGETGRAYELLYFLCDKSGRVLFSLHQIFGVLRHDGSGVVETSSTHPAEDAKIVWGDDFDHDAHKTAVQYPTHDALPHAQYVLTPSEVRAERCSNLLCELCEPH